MPRITKQQTLDKFEDWLFGLIEDKYGHCGYRKLLAGIIINEVRENNPTFFYTKNFKLYSRLVGCRVDNLQKICLIGINNYKQLYTAIRSIDGY